MKKFVIILLILISVTAVGFRYFKNKKKKIQNPPQAAQKQESLTATATPSSEPAASSSQSTGSGKPVKTYTMAEVAAHGADPNSEECWTVIHGKVYDILDFATNSHPGGEVIFDACGKDATKLFETRPMGSGTPHSAEARKILEKYYIGDLKQ